MNTMPPNVKKYYRMLYLMMGEEFDDGPWKDGDGVLKTTQDSLSWDDYDYISKNSSGWFYRYDTKVRFTKQFLEQIMEE